MILFKHQCHYVNYDYGVKSTYCCSCTYLALCYVVLYSTNLARIAYNRIVIFTNTLNHLLLLHCWLLHKFQKAYDDSN